MKKLIYIIIVLFSYSCSEQDIVSEYTPPTEPVLVEVCYRVVGMNNNNTNCANSLSIDIALTSAFDNNSQPSASDITTICLSSSYGLGDFYMNQVICGFKKYQD